MTQPRKRRPAKTSGTWYAVRGASGRWLDENGFWMPSFSKAALSIARSDARYFARYGPRQGDGEKFEIIPCRVSPLTSKRANPRRTR